MKKSRIIALLLSLIVILASIFSLSVPAAAADSDWVDVGNTAGEYAYSMAVIGDTQSLSVSDAKNYDTENDKFNDGYKPRMNKIYDWLVANKDSKNIQLVMGLGDIVETWQSRQDWTDAAKYSQYWDLQDLEWDLDKEQIKKLAEANIPFTLVRGNHDSDKAFAEEIGSFAAYTEQLEAKGGFYIDKYNTDEKGNNIVKYDTSYMKLEIGVEKKTKWLVIQLDWAVTTAELDWAAELITTHSDHQVILTMHNYLYRDATIDGKTGSKSTAVPNKNWDYSIDPTSPDLDPNLTFNPDGIWHRLVSKHENIKLVLCGHDTSDDIKVSQLVGEKGNTITQMLVDPQAMDLDTANPGGVGMVCMLYFRKDGTLVNSWDEKNIDVEWYSTIKDKFYKTSNQFTINTKLYEDGISTEYGVIPKEYADTDAYPFAVFAKDVDIDEYFFIGAYANWTTSAGGGAYASLSNFSGKNGLEIVVLLRRNFTMTNDTAFSNFGNYALTVNLDLNGFTFMNDYNETVGTDMSIFQTNLKKNVKTTFNVYGKEGSALLNGSSWSSLVTLGIGSSNANGAEFTYNFNGIKIGLGEGTKTTKFIAQTYDGSAGSANSVTQNLNFNNCTFDFVTNRPEGKAADMFLLNEAIGEAIGNAKANVRINGGNIIASDMSKISICKMNANDSFAFGTDENGKYTTFTLSSGAAAPTEIYKDTLGRRLEYVSVGDGVYELRRTSTAEPGSLGTIDVWLIGGQSNASGYGNDGLTDAKFDTRYVDGFDNILYYGSGDDNKVTEFVPLTVGLGNNTSSVGAEVGIAKMLGDTDTMNAVIKLGRGSSALYPKTTGDVSVTYGTWTSPSYVKNNGIDTAGTKIGALYNDFITTVAEGIAILVDKGYTPVIRGMWWMQGEAECSSEDTANAYEELLTCLINDLREDIEKNTGIESTEMPFVAGNIYRNGTKDANGNYVYDQPAYLSNINAAQASVAGKLNKVYTVATAGLPQKDNWHFIADAQQYLGTEFVKSVIHSENKYSVHIDGFSVSGTGLGAYAAGESVTVTLAGINGCILNKAYYVASGANPMELTVAGGVCTYSFTMPAADVTFEAESTDPTAEETKYGAIPSAYTNADQYPFILFKNGEFFKAYEDWNTILNSGNLIFVADAKEGREATLLLRRDYDTTVMGQDKHSQNLYLIEGHINFDLGGKKLIRGKNHLFQVMAKSASSKTVSTSFTFYNGTILALNNAPFVINTNTGAGADDHFYFTFNGVNFGFAEGATSTRLVFETYDNGSYDTIVTAVFNDCTFDAKNYAPEKSLCLFDLDEVNGSKKTATVTVNGGSIIANDLSTTAIYALGTTDKIYFEKGSASAYTTLNLVADVTVDGVYTTSSGDYLKFGNGVAESDGTYTYALAVADVEITNGYGAIDNALYPASEYPFALFTKQTDGTYVFKAAYKTYYSYLLDLRLNPTTLETVLYLRRNYEICSNSGDDNTLTFNGTSYTNIDRHFYYLKNKLTIDLNNLTLTRGSGNKTHSLQMMGNGINVTITVKNGTLHTATGTMIPFNNTGANPETTTLNFENVRFTAANVEAPWVDAYTGGSEGTTTTANITFTNCEFDLSALSGSSSKPRILFDLGGDEGKVNFNITIIGGRFISGDKGYTNVKLFTNNGTNDSLTFKKDNDGNYTRFEVKKGTAAPSYSFISGETGAPVLKMFADFSIFETASNEKTHNVYFLDEAVSVSTYNDLPKSLTGYTFLVFDKDKTAFVGYNTWYEIWANISTLRKASDLVVLMLKDYDTDNCAESSQNVYAAKNMVIDLNGHTLTRGNRHVFQLYEKGTNVTYTPNITVKNGTILSKKSYGTLMYFNSSNIASNVNLTFTFTFDGVTFTSTDEYIGRLVAETHATNGVNGITANITFNGCDFIVGGNVDSMFTLNDTSGKYAISAVINGGSITFNKKAPIALLGDNDNVTFGAYNGSYTTVIVKSGVKAPADSFMNTDGVECVFVKTSENGEYANYTLYPAVMVGYKIKTSVTLWSNFVYNVYIPKANVASFNVNGITKANEEIEIDGVLYYLVKVELPASESLSDIAVCVTLNSGDTTVDANWTLSVLKYAKSVIGGGYDDTTKNLMKDMLVYASAAHTYFENTENVADKLTEIDTLLGDYNAELPEGEAKAPADKTYFTSATVYLGEVPSFRFYLAEGYTADDFSFQVGQRNVTATTGEDKYGNYLEVVMYAYMMLDDVTYTVTDKLTKESVTESYNLYSYYRSADEANKNLIALVEGLMKYSVSAAAYRDSVIGAEN